MLNEQPKELVELIEQIMLNESIVVNGNELIAYCFVVAEEYTKMPAFDESEMWRWEAMVAHNEKLLPMVLSKVKVEYVEDDPYPSMKAMMYDMIVNRRMKIYKSGEGSYHPGIKPQENDQLRTVHDYFGHFSKNAKNFKAFLEKNGIKDGKDGKIAEYRFSGNNFTVRGEMNAYLTHAKLAPEAAKPALFQEIVGQICTYFTTGDYTSNKVGVLKGVDIKNIGRFTDQSLEKRKQKYMRDLEDENVRVIKTEIGTIPKTEINYGMLSRGEAQTYRKSLT